ncbi:cbb3-type cytochrome c oxidase subunit 3 [Pseudomonas sp. JQ170]|uniref:cbb3-type cytochrome c oxidase subunit 3 n=1 Tax=unclassified Pseudomonas TaxID=196821 RepID=UPI000FB84C84|nr:MULTISPECIES: cbb3-type cytochrome c oxidase subunit 3 [unclassified Pseudomonas]MDN7142468.1 cbb3-type cytochrome c oxidase subunit 3 [Pseudomonas sp. JQ170]WRO73973.1 cbb3-type cytochrome c oxidase subunit 3 [Pseudomonas sp. 170C]
MNEWLYALYCLTGVLFFYLVTSACLRGHSREVDDQVSLIPFADDPLVAQRVAQAIGKPVPAEKPDAAMKA